MERTHDEKNLKRIDHVICKRTCVQMEHLEDCVQKGGTYYRVAG